MPTLHQRRLAQAVARQAEQERGRLNRLAQELRLEPSPGQAAQEVEAAVSPSMYGAMDEEENDVRYSPTNASTTGLTSVSRAQDRFGRDRRAEEQATFGFKYKDAEHPLPAYQPRGVHRVEPVSDGGEGLGLDALHQKHSSRLPIANHFTSEWVECG